MGTTIQWGKKGQSLQKTVLEKLVIHMQRMKLDPYLPAPYVTNNSKLTTDLNRRPKNIKHLEENIGESFIILDLAMIS